MGGPIAYYASYTIPEDPLNNKDLLKKYGKSAGESKSAAPKMIEGISDELLPSDNDTIVKRYDTIRSRLNNIMSANPDSFMYLDEYQDLSRSLNDTVREIKNAKQEKAIFEKIHDKIKDLDETPYISNNGDVFVEFVDQPGKIHRVSYDQAEAYKLKFGDAEQKATKFLTVKEVADRRFDTENREAFSNVFGENFISFTHSAGNYKTFDDVKEDITTYLKGSGKDAFESQLGGVITNDGKFIEAEGQSRENNIEQIANAIKVLYKGYNTGSTAKWFKAAYLSEKAKTNDKGEALPTSYGSMGFFADLVLDAAKMTKEDRQKVLNKFGEMPGADGADSDGGAPKQLDVYQQSVYNALKTNTPGNFTVQGEDGYYTLNLSTLESKPIGSHSFITKSARSLISAGGKDSQTEMISGKQLVAIYGENTDEYGSYIDPTRVYINGVRADELAIPKGKHGTNVLDYVGVKIDDLAASKFIYAPSNSEGDMLRPEHIKDAIAADLLKNQTKKLSDFSDQELKDFKKEVNKTYANFSGVLNTHLKGVMDIMSEVTKERAELIAAGNANADELINQKYGPKLEAKKTKLETAVETLVGKVGIQINLYQQIEAELPTDYGKKKITITNSTEDTSKETIINSVSDDIIYKKSGKGMILPNAREVKTGSNSNYSVAHDNLSGELERIGNSWGALKDDPDAKIVYLTIAVDPNKLSNVVPPLFIKKNLIGTRN